MFWFRSISKAYLISAFFTDSINTRTGCEKLLYISRSRFFPVRTFSKMTSETFKFSNYDCIGFDLDNTLARYKVGNMIEMEYKIISDYLIRKGLSKEHLSKPLDHNFILKGLIIDNDNGNLLRISPSGEVIQATHGTKWLTPQEILEYYPNGHWEPTDLFTKDPLQTWNGPNSECMRTLLDYFDIVVSLIFARIVDSIDESDDNKHNYNVWPQLLECMVYMFDRQHFRTNYGEYFPAMKANPEKYYYTCSNNLRSWLRALKENGKKLFLITGAHVDFASHTASNTIGADWRDFFDIVVCYAKKPGFFTMKRDFIGLNGFTETNPIEYKDLQIGGIYTHGNWNELEKFMKHLSIVSNPKVLYIGDNMVQDIYTPHVHSNCDTVTVCEELEAERKHEFVESWHPDEQFLCSTIWGSYFHYENPNDATIWGQMIKTHSKICIPSLEYVANFPINHEFKSLY